METSPDCKPRYYTRSKLSCWKVSMRFFNNGIVWASLLSGFHSPRWNRSIAALEDWLQPYGNCMFDKIIVLKWKRCVFLVLDDMPINCMLGCQLPARDGMPLIPVLSVKRLDVILYASLSLEGPITNVTRLGFLYLFRALQLVPYLPHPDLAIVINATVISRTDNCNLLYVGLPLKMTEKLQFIQNTANPKHIGNI